MPSVSAECRKAEEKKERRAAIYTASEMEKHCAYSTAERPPLLRPGFNTGDHADFVEQ